MNPTVDVQYACGSPNEAPMLLDSAAERNLLLLFRAHRRGQLQLGEIMLHLEAKSRLQ